MHWVVGMVLSLSYTHRASQPIPTRYSLRLSTCETSPDYRFPAQISSAATCQISRIPTWHFFGFALQEPRYRTTRRDYIVYYCKLVNVPNHAKKLPHHFTRIMPSACICVMWELYSNPVITYLFFFCDWSYDAYANLINVSI